jgi:putative transposase
MSKTVRRAYKYRFYPSDEQKQELARTFGCVRYIYNRTLAERSRAYTQEHRKISYAESARWIAEWKREPETEWLSEVSVVPLQQTQRHLQTAYVNFWSKRSKYPRFKSKHHNRQSATYTRFGFTFRNGELKLAKMDQPLDIRWSRLLPEGSEPSTVTVTKDAADRYFISLLVETEIEELPAADRKIGVDAGITSLVTLSTGEKVKNPQHARSDHQRLKRAQQSLSRKQKGSRNRARARLKVARIHARIADRRTDLLHKLSTRLICENQAVMIEDLGIRNMVKNHKLARSISDSGWRQLRSMLEYKADWYGREIIAIDRWYPSSKTCSDCGHLLAVLPLNVREWTCPACGTGHDRDVNAARNILAVGLTVSACGDGVRPPRS